MNREYLNSFTDEQLQNYLTTLRRRVKDLRQLTVQLGAQNQELAKEYDDTLRYRTEVYHKNEKKKKSWGSWINKNVEKIGNLLHISNSGRKQPPADYRNNDLQTNPHYHNYQQEPSPQHHSNPNQPKYLYKDIPYQGMPLPPNYQKQQHPQYHYEGSNQPRDMPEGGGSLMSPGKYGMELINKGRERINRIFTSNNGNSNVQRDNGGYEYPQQNHSTLYGEIQHDIERMRQKNQKKRFESFLNRTQQPEFQQQQYPYTPDQRVYEQKQERQIWNSGATRVENKQEVMRREPTPEKQSGKEQAKQEQAKVEYVTPKKQEVKQEQPQINENDKDRQSKPEKQQFKPTPPPRILSSDEQQQQAPVTQQSLDKKQSTGQQQSEDNEYAVSYEAPTLEEITVNQIVEKSIGSQEQFQDPAATEQKGNKQAESQQKVENTACNKQSQPKKEKAEEKGLRQEGQDQPQEI